jgi:hypothetical protein
MDIAKRKDCIGYTEEETRIVVGPYDSYWKSRVSPSKENHTVPIWIGTSGSTRGQWPSLFYMRGLISSDGFRIST